MRKTHSAKPNIAETITAAIIERLERGVRPWVRPWKGAADARLRRPSRSCGTPYRGINTVVLGMIADVMDYASPYWMTYNHAQSLGGQVRKGERGSTAILYKTIVKRGSGDGDGETAEDERGVRRLLRGFTVFSADQIDGLPERFHPKPAPLPVSSPDARADELRQFFDRIPAVVRHGGDEAAYYPGHDIIHMPRSDQFIDAEHWAGTFAHELAHWSGHRSRLDRDLSGRFGSNGYAIEELVAEMASAMIGADLGTPVTHLDHHASYVGHWLGVLKQDPRAILTAAAKAEQAASYLLALGGLAAVASADADDEALALAA